MQTFGDLKTWVVDKLKSDGDSTYPLTTAGIAYGQIFSTRVKIHLQQYIRATYPFFTRSQAVTGVVAGATAADLSGLVPAVFEPERLYCNGVEITRKTMGDLATSHGHLKLSGASNTAPRYWAISREYNIEFDQPLDTASAASICVAGWTEHPTEITGDASLVRLPDYQWDVMSTFIATMFSKPVVADDVGAMRLKMYNEEAYNAMMTYRSRNIAEFYQYLRKP